MIDISNIVKFFNEHEGEYTLKDYLIMCGDVGMCGFSALEGAKTRSILKICWLIYCLLDSCYRC